MPQHELVARHFAFLSDASDRPVSERVEPVHGLDDGKKRIYGRVAALDVRKLVQKDVAQLISGAGGKAVPREENPGAQDSSDTRDDDARAAANLR
jgi:hypothetical protein